MAIKTSKTIKKSKARGFARISTAVAVAVLATTASLPLTAAAAQSEPKPAPVPTKTATSTEAKTLSNTPITEIVEEAEPLEAPVEVGRHQKGNKAADLGRSGRPEGPTVKLDGRPARTAGAVASSGTSAAAVTSQPGLWTGYHRSNPNRQIGKLYFDKKPGPGEIWSHCTATVVTAANKSTLITAGHCVFNPDPDENGVVDGNGYWYENIQFCPGYEYGCKMGSWKYRRVSTTPGWYYGYNGVYDFRDDVAVVLLNRDRSNRNIQDVTGSQGIIFNQYVGLKRYAFGYPAADYRWPQYKYNGEDLIYAIARDTYDTTKPGTMWIRSTMTGGSSGGPWIISPNGQFFGYVNSVNSHKPYGGAYMSGPYFGNAELQLFNTWKAA